LELWVGQAGIGVSFSTIQQECWIEHLKGFLAGNLCKVDTEVDAVIDKTEVVTPNFSEEEIGSISEAAL